MEFDKVVEEVLKRVKPSERERKEVNEISVFILDILKKLVKKHELEEKVRVEIEGSFAKDTWLSEDVDLDIFLLFNISFPLDLLRKYGLMLGEELAEKLGVNPVRRYASHPYIELNYGKVKIDIVPAYDVPSSKDVRTPVDRTPFHTRYIRNVISKRPELKDEIRLLKRFTKGIGIYGAEIKTEGFSGYLIEILVTYYGSFKDTVVAASTWKPWRTVIDLEGYYENKEIDVFKMFRAPLIVIDPIDEKRNAASAVSLEKLSLFVLACKEFLKTPSISFFYPHSPSIDVEKIKRELYEQNVIAIKTLIPSLPEDVLWGQVKRSLQGITDLLHRYGFRVFDTSAWTKGNILVMLFKLEYLERSKIEEHKGPPIYLDNSLTFISLNEKRSDVISGPYVKGDRLVVLRRVKYSKAEDVIKEKLNEAKLGKLISKYLKENIDVLKGANIVDISPEKEYLQYLYRWLTRRLPWRSH